MNQRAHVPPGHSSLRLSRLASVCYCQGLEINHLVQFPFFSLTFPALVLVSTFKTREAEGLLGAAKMHIILQSQRDGATCSGICPRKEKPVPPLFCASLLQS